MKNSNVLQYLIVYFFTSLLHSACACVSWTSANLLPKHPAQETTQLERHRRQLIKQLVAFCIFSSSYVHMKPHVVLFTDVCDFIDGVKGSIDSGTSGGIHKHWNIPLRAKEKDDSGLNSSYVLFSPCSC